MIKVYRYNDNRNSVSHILQGKNGVTVRYNFERGNVVTKQKPELVLKNEYAQTLLENSQLFKSHLVTLVRSERTAEDDAKDKMEQDLKNQTPQTPQTPTPVDVISVESVVSESDLLAFVNEKDGREGVREFRNPSKALEWASEHNYAFPNYKP